MIYCAHCGGDYPYSEFAEPSIPRRVLFANRRKLKYSRHKRCGGTTVWFATAALKRSKLAPTRG